MVSLVSQLVDSGISRDAIHDSVAAHQWSGLIQNRERFVEAAMDALVGSQ